MFQKNVDYFGLKLKWIKTDDPEYPYQIQYNEHNLQIKLNDFPDEVLYTLLVDGVSIKDFDDWPSSWKR